jgi:hypothetical protein
MRLLRLRSRFRAFAAALFCTLVAACATPEGPATTCVPVEGLDPTCLVNRPLLKEAIASYKAHYKKMKVGNTISYTEGGAAIPFTTNWLRTDKLMVVDFSKPAYERRLYIIDWKTGQVEAYHVSHGRGSALNERSYMAKRFTNLIGSGTSSVGAYVGGQRYDSPRWGLALRLQGLDSTNSRALERTIVFHANETFFDKERNIFGWSCGCFMMDSADLPKAINVLMEGGFLYAGPMALYDRSSHDKVRECNPFCGDQDRCKTNAGANPIGSLPGVAAPQPAASGPSGIAVPDPMPGQIPIPVPKPNVILTLGAGG